MRRIRYQEIADDLRRRIKNDEFPAGQVLPSEAALGASYEASRVTVRKSLEVLRSQGLLDSKQGFGWFVPSEVLAQPLTGLATIEGQLERSGRESVRRILDFQFVEAPALVAQTLGSRVLEVRRLHLSDGRPLARVTVWCREDLGAELSKADVERQSFYEVLGVPLGGASQTIGAAVVDPDDAVLLQIPGESAVLTVLRTTMSREGEPVLMSEHVFPAHLTQFVVELPTVEDSFDRAASIRLVE
ncbi:MAG: GntR family transcriptional regulator [Acidimicrobiales bacterium]